jgi:hypothetical protein
MSAAKKNAVADLEPPLLHVVHRRTMSPPEKGPSMNRNVTLAAFAASALVAGFALIAGGTTEARAFSGGHDAGHVDFANGHDAGHVDFANGHDAGHVDFANGHDAGHVDFANGHDAGHVDFANGHDAGHVDFANGHDAGH